MLLIARYPEMQRESNKIQLGTGAFWYLKCRGAGRSRRETGRAGKAGSAGKKGKMGTMSNSIK